MADFSFDKYLQEASKYKDVVERRNIAEDAIAAFQSNPRLGALRQDTESTKVKLHHSLEPGTRGSYTFADQSVDVSTGFNRYNRTAEEIETTIVHELTHAAQGKHSSRDTFSRTAASVDSAAKAVGHTDDEIKQLWQDLDAAQVTYGGGEIAAHLVPAYYAGAAGSKEGVRAFVSKYPEFTKRYAELNVNPNRPVQKHTKGYPEMNIAEKALFDLFGYAGNIDPAAPLAAARNLRLGKE